MISRVPLFALLLLVPALGAAAEPLYANIDNAQLKALLAQGTPVYDIRRPEEWQQTGVVPGSRKLTYVDASGRLLVDFMPRFTGEVRRDEPVIVICRVGNRSERLARELVGKLGYTRVYNLRHGISGWIAEGNPVLAH